MTDKRQQQHKTTKEHYNTAQSKTTQKRHTTKRNTPQLKMTQHITKTKRNTPQTNNNKQTQLRETSCSTINMIYDI